MAFAFSPSAAKLANLGASMRTKKQPGMGGAQPTPFPVAEPMAPSPQPGQDPIAALMASLGQSSGLPPMASQPVSRMQEPQMMGGEGPAPDAVAMAEAAPGQGGGGGLGALVGKLKAAGGMLGGREAPEYLPPQQITQQPNGGDDIARLLASLGARPRAQPQGVQRPIMGRPGFGFGARR